MPNYDQTGPNGQGPTGRRGQNGNQNTTPGQDNSLLTSLRRRLRRGNSGDSSGQGQNKGRGQGNKGRGRGGNNGNCRYRNNG